ncbi:MAG: OB-fold domain-containing protein [Dehalococcoidia bacterium]
MKWKEASGVGTVYSFSVVRRAAAPAFQGMIPYIVALVDLEEGIRMITHITDCDPEKLKIGARVVVHFREQGEFKLPVFRPQ